MQYPEHSGFNVMNSVDVKEVVLVVVGNQPFHLRRIHTAVRLADVDHRQVQRGEDVDGHAFYRQFDAAKLQPIIHRLRTNNACSDKHDR